MNPTTAPASPAPLWRQGDVLIQRCSKKPDYCNLLEDTDVLFYGAASGNAHKIRRQHGVQVWFFIRDLYIEVTADEAEILHPEHKSLKLPPGIYRVWQQREWNAFTQSASDMAD